MTFEARSISAESETFARKSTSAEVASPLTDPRSAISSAKGRGCVPVSKIFITGI
jgi:hypothetical protein